MGEPPILGLIVEPGDTLFVEGACFEVGAILFRCGKHALVSEWLDEDGKACDPEQACVAVTEPLLMRGRPDPTGYDQIPIPLSGAPRLYLH